MHCSGNSANSNSRAIGIGVIFDPRISDHFGDRGDPDKQEKTLKSASALAGALLRKKRRSVVSKLGFFLLGCGMGVVFCSACNVRKARLQMAAA